MGLRIATSVLGTAVADRYSCSRIQTNRPRRRGVAATASATSVFLVLIVVGPSFIVPCAESFSNSAAANRAAAAAAATTTTITNDLLIGVGSTQSQNFFRCNRHRHHPFQKLSSSSILMTLAAQQGDDGHNSNSMNKNQNNDNANTDNHSITRIEQLASAFTLLTPLWTILASGCALWKASWCSEMVGSRLGVMQTAYCLLMLTMGLAISKTDFERARDNGVVVAWNALLCFGVMPLLAIGIATLFRLPHHHTTGLVVLGSVGGGQASNLFALLAGGNVALSVLCTISTTLLGVVATPLWLKLLLGTSGTLGMSGFVGVLESIVSLVMLPVLVGSALSNRFPEFFQRISGFLPVMGVLATLVLVVGGSSNSVLATTKMAGTSIGIDALSSMASILLPSCLLGVLGGGAALGVATQLFPRFKGKCRDKDIDKDIDTNDGNEDERTKRTLVVETLSKSPTLAYLLCLKHFGASEALIPGGAMVTLAVLGALVASIWSRIDGMEDANSMSY